jgi:hypothetical protein
VEHWDSCEGIYEMVDKGIQDKRRAVTEEMLELHIGHKQPEAALSGNLLDYWDQEMERRLLEESRQNGRSLGTLLKWLP